LPRLADLLHLGDAGLSALLGDWLEGVYTASDFDAALAARSSLTHGEVIMTREGHAVSQFAVSFYAPDSEQAGMLARAQEIEQLERESKAQALITDESRAALIRLEASYTDAAQRLQSVRREASDAQTRAHELHVELLRLSSQAEAATTRRTQLEDELAEIDAQDEGLIERRMTGEARFEELDQQLATTQERQADLEEAVIAAERKLSDAREQLRALERRAQEAQYDTRALSARQGELHPRPRRDHGPGGGALAHHPSGAHPGRVRRVHAPRHQAAREDGDAGERRRHPREVGHRHLAAGRLPVVARGVARLLRPARHAQHRLRALLDRRAGLGALRHHRPLRLRGGRRRDLHRELQPLQPRARLRLGEAHHGRHGRLRNPGRELRRGAVRERREQEEREQEDDASRHEGARERRADGGERGRRGAPVG